MEQHQVSFSKVSTNIEEQQRLLSKMQEGMDGLFRLILSQDDTPVPRLAVLIPGDKVTTKERLKRRLNGKIHEFIGYETWTLYPLCEGKCFMPSVSCSSACTGYTLRVPGPKLRKVAPFFLAVYKVLRVGAVASGIPLPDVFSQTAMGKAVVGCADDLENLFASMSSIAGIDANSMSADLQKDPSALSSPSLNQRLYGDCYDILKSLMDCTDWNRTQFLTKIFKKRIPHQDSYWFCEQHCLEAAKNSDMWEIGRSEIASPPALERSKPPSACSPCVLL